MQNRTTEKAKPDVSVISSNKQANGTCIPRYLWLSCHPEPDGEIVSVTACFNPRHDPSHGDIRRGPNRLDPFLERLSTHETLTIIVFVLLRCALQGDSHGEGNGSSALTLRYCLISLLTKRSGAKAIEVTLPCQHTSMFFSTIPIYPLFFILFLHFSLLLQRKEAAYQ